VIIVARMKLREIYDARTYGIGTLYSVLCHRDMPECREFECSIEEDRNTRVQVRDVFFKSIDGTRDVHVHSVFFDGQPVMVIRSAGRGGEYHDRFVSDAPRFSGMIDYLRSISDMEPSEETPADVNIEALDEFYGFDMRAALGPRSQVDS
jgi:hypothetical protein